MEINDAIEWAIAEVTFKQQSTESVGNLAIMANDPANPFRKGRISRTDIEVYLAAIRTGQVKNRGAYQHPR